MKVQLDYSTFTNFCLAMAEKINEYKPDELVCVMRGGMSASHIIAKTLGLPCGTFFPKKDDKLVFSNDNSKKIVFIEDLIAKGRTYNIVYAEMSKKTDIEWMFSSVLIDSAFAKFIDYNKILTYGMISPQWIVMPYEENNKMVEGDHGLFRDGSDQYGKKNQ